MNRILVTGITSLKQGAMENDNLGNFVIIEPMFRSLRSKFPNSVIQTTIQLSKEFAQKFSLEVITSERFWKYTFSNSILTIFELFNSIIWYFLNRFNIELNFLLSQKLKIYKNSDLIIDFSGDMFGENALNNYQFIIGGINPLIAKFLRRKIYFVASSPGPFRSFFKLIIAKMAFYCFDLLSVREPMSKLIINSIGNYGDKLVMYPCFSFGFKPTNLIDDFKLQSQEPRLFQENIQLIGLILCNHNMTKLPLNKWPRDDEEYKPFLELISHILNNDNIRICIISHRYKFSSDGKLKPGSDHYIIERLIDLLPNNHKTNVFTLSGEYNAANMNKIIGRFEILISGRIHGAVQGILQNIPTMIIDYGMEPKAHKLFGFAILTNLVKYFSDPSCGENLIRNFDKIWEDRFAIKKELLLRVPQIIQSSQDVWEKIRILSQRGS